MRSSFIAWARAVRPLKSDRTREVQRLAATARRDVGRSWSRKTAIVLEVCVRNEPTAPSTWDAVRLFGQLPPQKSDVTSLLPVLQQQAGRARDANQAILAVGDMAHANGLLHSLSSEFLHKYLVRSGTQNPYRAISLWKELPSRCQKATTGAALYIAANQPARAERLVADATAVAPSLIRQFIEKYAACGDADSVQKWICRWQAPTPADINWLHHTVGNVPDLRKLRLPLPLHNRTLFPVRRSVSERVQHLVSAVNKVLSESPQLFEAGEVRLKWRDSIASPSLASLEALALEVARVGAQCDWTPVIKLVSFSTGLQICEHAGKPSSSAYASLLARAGTQADVATVLKLVSAAPDALYTRECLSALAQRSPTMLLELAVPQDLLETTLTPHQQAALWRAGPPQEVIAWLLPLTRKNADHAGLLRSACLALLAVDRMSDARDLLYEFVVVKRLKLDTRIVNDLARALRGEAIKPQKLPRPKPSGLHMDEAERKLNSIVADLRSASNSNTETNDH